MTNIVTNADGTVSLQLPVRVETFYLPTITVMIFVAVLVVLAIYQFKASKRSSK